MANITLGWNNRTDSGTLSGGSWQSTLPLSNLQTRQVQKVARTLDAAVASTQFLIDLGQARTIGALALVVHNISVTGEVRITGSDTAASFTNVLTSPRDYSNAAWVKTNVTVTANSITAPDGTATATRLEATASAATNLNQDITATSTTATLTLYVKQGSGATDANSFVIRNQTTATNLLNITVNYSTGAITYVTGASGATMTAVSDNWWRLTLTVSSGITVGNTLRLYPCFSGNTETAGEFAYVADTTALASYAPLFDSNWNTVWPSGVIPLSLLEWEEDNFWLGTLSSNARAGYQSPYIYLMSTAQTLRYWEVEIADTGNSDGYVQIGRLFMSSTWVPSVNYSYGAAIGYQDPTPIDVSLSGAEYFDVRSKFRVFEFELQYILGTEAYSNALELQRLSGNSGEVLIVPDKEDTTNQPARSFVGRLLQIGTITQPQPTAFTVKFQVKELL